MRTDSYTAVFENMSCARKPYPSGTRPSTAAPAPSPKYSAEFGSFQLTKRDCSAAPITSACESVSSQRSLSAAMLSPT